MIRLAFAVALVAGTACAPGRSDHVVADTLPWQLDSLHQVMPDCAGTDQACAEVRLEWVVVGGLDSAVADSINASLDRMILADGAGAFTSRDSLVAALFTSFGEFRKDFADAPGGWFDERMMSVACNTPTEFVVRVDAANHFGGAHPNSATVFASFDPVRGTTTDWRVRADSAAILSVAERYFRVERELPDSGSLNEAGWQFDDDRFALPSQGMWCEGNLTLRYNPYEVGAYALGITEFTIPASEIQPR